MEWFAPGGNFPVKVVHPEVVLFDRSVQSERRPTFARPKIEVPFSEIFVSSLAPARHHNQNSGWFRWKFLRLRAVCVSFKCET